uniref:Uncharacterized protein n=1 Tax=Cacopsylla melanoneura TaxID=428564 RepID=A0A8D8Y4M3_9HEMI
MNKSRRRSRSRTRSRSPMARDRDRSSSDYSYDKDSKRRKRHSPAYKSFSNERNNRTRRHVFGSSAERRFKRSHRRSPFSDEYKDNKYALRSGSHHQRSVCKTVLEKKE